MFDLTTEFQLTLAKKNISTRHQSALGFIILTRVILGLFVFVSERTQIKLYFITFIKVYKQTK